jgi:hypothetical protein
VSVVFYLTLLPIICVGIKWKNFLETNWKPILNLTVLTSIYKYQWLQVQILGETFDYFLLEETVSGVNIYTHGRNCTHDFESLHQTTDILWKTLQYIYAHIHIFESVNYIMQAVLIMEWLLFWLYVMVFFSFFLSFFVCVCIRHIAYV